MLAAVVAGFLADHPKAAVALARAHLDAKLAEDQPCAALGDDDPAVSEALVSPDGARIAVLAAYADKGGLATHLLLVDDHGVRAFAPTSFPRCGRGAELVWSEDSQRVSAMVDTGHGERVALAGTRLIVDVFASYDVGVSPELRHLAWVPWSARWPDDESAVEGAVLRVDGMWIWGAAGGHTTIRDVEWLSESELVFCGGRGGGEIQYRAVLGKTVTVRRIGNCDLP